MTENQFLISHSVVVCTHAWRSCWKLILASNVIEVFFFNGTSKARGRENRLLKDDSCK